MHHPELFSSACPLSAAVRNESIDEFRARLKTQNIIIKDETKLQAYYERHSALVQLDKNKLEDLKSVKWYFDCGDDDFLFEGNSLVHIAFRKKEIPHEFRIRDGAHNWTYWRTSLPDVLSFVSDTFRQK